jgi:hypothetical protein
LDSSRKYRGDSVGSGTTAILVSGTSLGVECSAAEDKDAASAAPVNEAPRKNRILKVIY